MKNKQLTAQARSDVNKATYFDTKGSFLESKLFISNAVKNRHLNPESSNPTLQANNSPSGESYSAVQQTVHAFSLYAFIIITIISFISALVTCIICQYKYNKTNNKIQPTVQSTINKTTNKLQPIVQSSINKTTNKGQPIVQSTTIKNIKAPSTFLLSGHGRRKAEITQVDI